MTVAELRQLLDDYPDEAIVTIVTFPESPEWNEAEHVKWEGEDDAPSFDLTPGAFISG